MPYFSKFYKVWVRNSIAKEFTDSRGKVDDMMAGLHEIRVRMAEEKYAVEKSGKRMKVLRIDEGKKPYQKLKKK
ncbi:hypothetical protein AUJ66_02500 [Candidatus Desantisbacteria bacterium CG1_02_38_46]|uniref:Uncharacterized protein n=3 Tax=unclassified Candidatus Desantisiibacteriota TaxID=3106372 RepID=A0A2H9PCY6_9BACT|nr:MAG: hypothetical protein AUJ66_02500 [Candidatus Desantisbacteria bacterium CG1_02_38_46]PIU51111.1 MAG: hypothetical protein COS91_06150 [Candidatus Desantisbacteria bacterium CG07_land_8_20_14_0_80_39_15]PIZ16397.1 MAG: hypothetical protein COY51_02920 [Candidatus Desantisbacteria bacterium CG_4_10_14_0_8_um_filter_39_17]